MHTRIRSVGLFGSIRDGCGCFVVIVLGVIGLAFVFPPAAAGLAALGLLAPFAHMGNRYANCPRCGQMLQLKRKRSGGVTCRTCRTRLWIRSHLLIDPGSR